LFDRHYEDPTGFQRPGFGFFAGVRVAWDVKVPAGKTATQSFAKDITK
jgi:hypothetical protein